MSARWRKGKRFLLIGARLRRAPVGKAVSGWLSRILRAGQTGQRPTGARSTLDEGEFH